MRVENSKFVLEVTEKASEITSFKNKETGIEYMWQGDPAFWAGRNPTLFPIVGSTWTKSYEIDGKTYTMGNHGFTRHSTFTCVETTENSLTMRLCDSPETLAQYPFPFQLDIKYTLKDDTVAIDYTITNTGERDMPFCFGLHPAFNCPLLAGESRDDYYLEFAQSEKLHRLQPSLEFVEDDFETKRIELDYDTLFKTIVLEHVQSPTVQLTNGTHGVEVSVAGYRYLAFWCKPGSGYVCIEPWHAMGDMKENNYSFYERPGTIVLAPKDTFETGYTVKAF